MVMRVGVKFCGNCNPHVFMPELLRSLVQATTEFEFVSWSTQEGYELLLLLSSCQVGCATQPTFDTPYVAVTSESVQRWPVRESDLVAVILNALRNYR